MKHSISKKILATTLAVAMIGTLAACNGKDNGENKKKDPNIEVTSPVDNKTPNGTPEVSSKPLDNVDDKNEKSAELFELVFDEDEGKDVISKLNIPIPKYPSDLEAFKEITAKNFETKFTGIKEPDFDILKNLVLAFQNENNEDITVAEIHHYMKNVNTVYTGFPDNYSITYYIADTSNALDVFNEDDHNFVTLKKNARGVFTDLTIRVKFSENQEFCETIMNYLLGTEVTKAFIKDPKDTTLTYGDYEYLLRVNQYDVLTCEIVPAPYETSEEAREIAYSIREKYNGESLEELEEAINYYDIVDSVFNEKYNFSAINSEEYSEYISNLGILKALNKEMTEPSISAYYYNGNYKNGISYADTLSNQLVKDEDIQLEHFFNRDIILSPSKAPHASLKETFVIKISKTLGSEIDTIVNNAVEALTLNSDILWEISNHTADTEETDLKDMPSLADKVANGDNITVTGDGDFDANEMSTKLGHLENTSSGIYVEVTTPGNSDYLNVRIVRDFSHRGLY